VDLRDWIIAAVLVLCAVLIVRRVWAWCSKRVIERIRPVRGRFGKLEAEVLGRPPAPPLLVSGESNAALASSGATQASSLPAEPSPPKDRGGVRIAAAVADGATPAAGYIWDWAHLDDRLFHAIEQMTHHSVDSLADMSHAISAHEWATGSFFGPVDGLVQSVKGHFAEWLSAEHLLQAGHHVDMAALSNQAGLDFHVDDLPVNVKSVRDATAALHEHFQSYPDISVILPSDAAHIPADALHFDPSHVLDVAQLHSDTGSVIVDDALSNAYAEHATADGLDVASGHVHSHIPWVTIAFSSVKEAQLLWKGHTNLTRAAKNVAVDALSVGTGTAVGAKSGAVIGTFVAPGLGTVIGVVIGGVFGGVIGRLFANAAKRRPLEAARSEYEMSAKKLAGAEVELQALAEKEWAGCVSQQQTWLSQEGEKAKAECHAAIARKAAALRITSGQAAAVLREAKEDLRQKLRHAHDKYYGFPLWRRWLWPSSEILTARRQWRIFRQDLLLWEAQRSEVEGVLALWGDNMLDEVFDLALVSKKGEELTRAFLIDLGLRRAKAVMASERAMNTAVARIAKARAQANDRLRVKQREIIDGTKAKLPLYIDGLRQAQENFMAELRKAGVEVSTA
jgi:hypothetical protein